MKILYLTLIFLSLEGSDKSSPKTPKIIENININVTTDHKEEVEKCCEMSAKVKVALIGLGSTTVISVIGLIAALYSCK